MVEAGHHLVGQGLQQAVDDLLADLSRVDVSVEVIEQDQAGGLLGQRHVGHRQALWLPCVQVLRIKHVYRSSSCSYGRTSHAPLTFPFRCRAGA